MVLDGLGMARRLLMAGTLFPRCMSNTCTPIGLTRQMSTQSTHVAILEMPMASDWPVTPKTAFVVQSLCRTCATVIRSSPAVPCFPSICHSSSSYIASVHGIPSDLGVRWTTEHWHICIFLGLIIRQQNGKAAHVAEQGAVRLSSR